MHFINPRQKSKLTMFKIQIYLHILRIVVYSYDEKEKRLLSDSSGFSFFPSRMH